MSPLSTWYYSLNLLGSAPDSKLLVFFLQKLVGFFVKKVKKSSLNTEQNVDPDPETFKMRIRMQGQIRNLTQRYPLPKYVQNIKLAAELATYKVYLFPYLQDVLLVPVPDLFCCSDKHSDLDCVFSLGGGGEAGGLLAVLLQLGEVLTLPQRPLPVSLHIVFAWTRGKP